MSGTAAAAAAPRIVVVDDEPDLRAMLEDYLAAQGFAVRGAADARELDRLFAAAEGPPDLLILDVNMPGEDGFAVLRRLRAAGCRAGVLMLTAAAVDLPDRVAGLDGGADDYLVKPVGLRELLARVRSVLRRLEADRGGGAEGPGPSPLPAAAPPPGRRRPRFGRCELDLDARRLLDAATGAEVPLTAMEYDLLATLARHPRQILARDRLAELAHGRPLEPGDRSVDIRIARLRRKLERDPAEPAAIRTARGLGYVYEPDG